MATSTVADDEAQLKQTIEMFEVIVQSQPNDCQSLEILKEAYKKLGRESDVINTSKRIAQAYVQSGQLSSAILEFETVLQQNPNDSEVLAALKSIQDTAGDMSAQPADEFEPAAMAPVAEPAVKTKAAPSAHPSPKEVQDGRDTMYKIFVESKTITAGDFDLCWRPADYTAPVVDTSEPFILTIAGRGILPLEKSLKMLADKSRLGYLPLDRYDVDVDLARGFPGDVCRRWCIFPFDRMSKAVLVATANPFNQQAAKELAQATPFRILWYLSSPNDLISYLKKAFR